MAREVGDGGVVAGVLKRRGSAIATMPLVDRRRVSPSNVASDLVRPGGRKVTAGPKKPILVRDDRSGRHVS